MKAARGEICDPPAGCGVAALGRSSTCAGNGILLAGMRPCPPSRVTVRNGRVASALDQLEQAAIQLDHGSGSLYKQVPGTPVTAEPKLRLELQGGDTGRVAGDDGSAMNLSSRTWLRCMIVPEVTEVSFPQAAHSQLARRRFSPQTLSWPQAGRRSRRSAWLRDAGRRRLHRESAHRSRRGSGRSYPAAGHENNRRTADSCRKSGCRQTGIRGISL